MSKKNISIDSNEFIDKKNISFLYNQIIKKKNLSNESRDRKKIVIDTLVNNMKKVYKSLDLTKINKNNYSSIFKQFNNICLEETEKKLNIALKVSEQEQISKLKFERDFNSQPHREIKIMERPIVTENFKNDDNISKIKSFNNFNNFLNNDNSNVSSFDNAFKMNVSSSSGFNAVQMGKNSKDLQQKLAELENEYNNNTNTNKRPSTPEFLKPIKTKINDEVSLDNLKNNNNNININNQQNSENLNFKPKLINNNNNNNNDFLSNNIEEGNFTSIDNFENNFKPKEIVDENISFEERLKNLQHERENFTVNEKENVSNIEMGNDNNQLEQQQIHQQEQQQIHQQDQQQLEQKLEQQQLEQKLEQQQLELQQLELQQFEQKKIVNREENLELFKYIKNLEDENNELKNYLNKAEEIINDLNSKIKTSDDDKLELANIKNQIKKQYYALELRFEEVKQMEIDIENKKDLIQQMINNYNLQIKKNYINVEIENKNSVYTHEISLNNVNSLKLVSYSLPIAKFNIDENSNKLIYYVLSDENKKEITLKKGKYNIENLILHLNDKIKDFKFSLEIDQKIRLLSTKEIKLEENILSKNILGFNNFNFNKDLLAEKDWDLRIHDRLYLYVNLDKDSENILIGILYFNQIISNEVTFEHPININNIKVFIVDENGNYYDFNNNIHNLSFRFEIHSNQSSKIDIST